MDARDPDTWPIRGTNEIVIRASRVRDDGTPDCYQAIIRAPSIAQHPFVGMRSSARAALQSALDAVEEYGDGGRRESPPSGALIDDDEDDDDLSFI